MDQFEFWRWPDEQTPLRRAGGPSSTTTRVLSEGPFATTRQTRQPFRPSSFRRRSQILHLAAVELLDLVGVGRRGWIRHLRVRTASGGQNSRKDGNCKKHHDTDQLPLHTSSLKTPRTDCATPCCTVSYAGRLVRSNYRRRYHAGRLLWSSVREYVAESSWNATGLDVLNPRQVCFLRPQAVGHVDDGVNGAAPGRYLTSLVHVHLLRSGFLRCIIRPFLEGFTIRCDWGRVSTFRCWPAVD